MLYTDALLETRARLQELVEDFWLDNELYRAINEGITRFAMEEKWPYLYSVDSDIPMAANAGTLELHPGVSYERHFNMLLTFSGDTRPRKPRRVHPSEGMDLRMKYSTAASNPLAYYIESMRRQADTVQRLSNVGDPAGTFTLTYSGQTTAVISRSATAAVVEAALVALSNVAPADVEVTGGPLGQDEIRIRFNAVASGQALAAMTIGATSTNMAIAVESAGALGSVYTPVVRFVPALNRACTVEYQFIRDPVLTTSSFTGAVLDVPDEYAMGVCAYAAGHAFLKELQFSGKADEQFALYQKVVSDAKREARKVTPDRGLVWGRTEPEFGWTDPADELLYSIPDTLG